MKYIIRFCVLPTLVILPLLFQACDICGIFDNMNTTETNAGDTLWSHTLPQGDHELWIHEAPLAIGLDGSIYYEASGGQANWEPSRIFAINKNDGSLKWKTEPLEIWHLNSSIMVGDNGTIYVLSYTKLYAIDPVNGQFNWVWEVPETMTINGSDIYTYGEVGGLALANNGDLIFKTNGGGVYYRAMYCVGQDGTMKWYRIMGAEITPITVGYNGVIYDFEHLEGSQVLTASDPLTGQLLWTRTAMPISSINNVLITENGDIIANVALDTLVRINPVTHQTLWKIPSNTNHKYKISDPEGFMYMYDQITGTYRFDLSTGSQNGNPVLLPHFPVIDSKGQLLGIINDSDPHISATNNSGTVIWENNTDNYLNNTLAISDDKIIYISTYKKIYAIQGDAKLAQTGWPRISHDNRNTFNYSK